MLMRVAYICSNYLAIDKRTANGTAIFNYTLLAGLSAVSDRKDVDVTVFASGNSTVPYPVVSVDVKPSATYPHIDRFNKHVIFELTLLSKAFSLQEHFDLYHINIGDGDISLPFIPFVKKPVLITLHHLIDEDFTRRHFDLYTHHNHLFFVSASMAQRQIVPQLNYIANIPHGTDVEAEYEFDATGGEGLIWAGRIVPGKGIDDLIVLAKTLQLNTRLFGIRKHEHKDYFEHIERELRNPEIDTLITLTQGKSRHELIPYFKQSKAFVFPIHAAEAFGLVLIEAMACGTAVIAYARSSVPEIVIDGETGFLVDPKEGVNGLIEATKRLYALSPETYGRMRRRCREHAVSTYSTQRMATSYIEVYRQLSSRADMV
jgi:glycosyltransferase involved in cell wall biosynthesis